MMEKGSGETNHNNRRVDKQISPQGRSGCEYVEESTGLGAGEEMIASDVEGPHDCRSSVLYCTSSDRKCQEP